MTKYFRVILGKSSAFAAECFAGNFIGVDFDLDIDLHNKLPDNWRDFNKSFVPIYLEKHPDKSKVAAGLACGMTWTVSKGMQIGDIIIAPFGEGNYRVGAVSGDYYYAEGENLFHRRNVNWSALIINRNQFSDRLRNSVGSIGTVSDITQHTPEIEKLIAGVDYLEGT